MKASSFSRILSFLRSPRAEPLEALEAQVKEAAAWRTWLDDPCHRAAVAQKATGEVKKKVKRAKSGRAKAPKSQSKKKH